MIVNQENNSTGSAKKRSGYSRLICLLTSFALLCTLMAACGEEQQDNTSAPESINITETTQATTSAATTELAVDSVEEQGDMVVVSTSYGILKYPFAFSDLIQVEAENSQDQVALIFSMKLDLSSYKLFTIVFGGSEGIHIGTLTPANGGQPMEVYAVLHEADGALAEDQINTFLAAQECFNDVANSLMENEGFVAAE